MSTSTFQKLFGTLKLQQDIMERDNIQESLPDAIPEDAQGNILHDEFITQWQEHSWIYEAVVNSLNDDAKATITS